MSTRVCVKQLPTHATEQKLRELFTEVAPVTDCRIMRRKDGRSRRFAFVGFATPEHAEKALEMDKVFLGTTRVKVEAAFEFGKGTPVHGAKPAKPAAEVRQGADSGPAKDAPAAPGKGFEEYKAVMANRNAAATWANDDAATSNARARKRGDALGASGPEDSAKAAALGSDAEESDSDADAPADADSDSDSDSDSDDGLEGEEGNGAGKGSGGKGADAAEDDDEMAALMRQAEASVATGAASASALSFLQSKRNGGAAGDTAAEADDEEEDEEELDDDDDAASEASDDSALDIEGGEIRRSSKRQRPAGTPADDLAELRVADDADSDSEGGAAAPGSKRARTAEGAEDQLAAGRLFVRNLPFTCSDDDLRAHFARWGDVTEARVPRDAAGRSKGFGFVAFAQAACAAAAMAEADLRMFQGRLLHVLPGKKAPKGAGDDEDDDAPAAGPGVSEYQAAKEQARRRAAASGEEAAAWNGLFVRADAAVKAAAAAAGKSAGEVLDPSADNLAVRVALGETAVIDQTKSFLRAQGVDLAALQLALGGKKLRASMRSDTVILVKNLPAAASAPALRGLFGRFGPLVRLVLPPAKVLAVVEFERPVDAKRAFKGLAYKRYESVPLYLEWAPTGTVSADAPAQPDPAAAAAAAAASAAAEAAAAGADGEDAAEEGAASAAPSGAATVFVKGLAFSTSEGGVEELFATVGPVRAVKIPRRAAVAGREGQSLGYGFVEFEDPAHATQAVKRLQATVLDGRALDLSISRSAPRADKTVQRRAAKDASGTAPPTRAATKLLVKNLAFEATRDDLRQLFGAFGKLRNVRLPRKQGGSGRGFGFVEFASAADARTAVSSLASSHLYGRHLVIQWAQDDGSLGALHSKAARAADKEAEPAPPQPQQAPSAAARSDAPEAEEASRRRRPRGGRKHKPKQ